MITEADRPAAEPKNSSRAGTKSPELIPCRYISGSTSATFGDFLAHGGRIEDRNRILSPVSSSTRRSSTRGARTSIGPAPVTSDRAIGMAIADHQAMALVVALVGQARSRRRRPRPPGRRPACAAHPSATSSSSVLDSSASAAVSTCTLNIGVPSSPAFHRQRFSVVVKEEGTSRPRSGGASTGSGYNSSISGK